MITTARYKMEIDNEIVKCSSSVTLLFWHRNHFAFRGWWGEPGLADLNHVDLNHRFKLQFKSIDFC